MSDVGGGAGHGEASPAFLIGSHLHPAVHDKHPGLATLHRGAVCFGCDIPRVHAAVLRDWLDVGPEKALHLGFIPLRLLVR
jgi:hypothetical protein